MDDSDVHLAVEIQHVQGPLTLLAQFKLTEPWTILFGPSGSGKTTILRTIAGFVKPDRACIVLRPNKPDSQVLVDSATKRFMASHRRHIRSAAQTAWMFPGTVWRNVCFAVHWKMFQDRDETILKLFRIEDLMYKKVRELSGGERHRVSLARAVAAATYGSGIGLDRVRLLLLDEPFTGLDSRMRDELVADLKPWLQQHRVAVLSVTHDPVEALLLDAEVIRIADGRCVAQGPAKVVLAEELARLRGITGEAS